MTTQNMVNNISSGFKSVNVIQFAPGGTLYTPTYGLIGCQVEIIGGGGSGGGAQTTLATQVSSAGGGGAGGYVRAYFTAAQIGASKSLAVGSGGAGSAASNSDGNAGGNTTFGTSPTLLTATGGAAGKAGVPTISNSTAAGGAGGSFSVDASVLNFWGANGAPGMPSIALTNGVMALPVSGAAGGNAIISSASRYHANTSAGANPVNGFGGGNTGVNITLGVNALASGAGANGCIIITEFLK